MFHSKEDRRKDLNAKPDLHDAGPNWYAGEQVRTLKILTETLLDIRDSLEDIRGRMLSRTRP